MGGFYEPHRQIRKDRRKAQQREMAKRRKWRAAELKRRDWTDEQIIEEQEKLAREVEERLSQMARREAERNTDQGKTT